MDKHLWRIAEEPFQFNGTFYQYTFKIQRFGMNVGFWFCSEDTLLISERLMVDTNPRFKYHFGYDEKFQEQKMN